MTTAQRDVHREANEGHPWYKDAVIYQLHVKSFFDGNGDGIGDFAGLVSKLDYIAELGANTIWLLPFYPSPRRDDGYDITDYRNVHPDYGSLVDFRHFIREAHSRGIRVIADFVVNHTSDQHPWFRRARHAKAGSLWRNFYVWSDNDQKYGGTRILFVDAEKSNWTWDAVAGAYYWHRFYSHQPDLNFEEPQVVKAILGAMTFWFRLGVDGLRLGAVPYLAEREGTNNENLPETHQILRHFRSELDRDFPDRTFLAEVNQWPEEVKEYFGEGDECHMAFHFPLMPRMYMAIAREDRFPISDIIRQTPAIPERCQWAIFLRNHDELTLEMVTDSERDFLWRTYASDRRSRINLGIRRRLAPLVQGDRRRIELLNSLLLSMPGTPVIYYGDELGMGDNIHLGDRDGVRTPMQWSPDRNGGFSRADPPVLVLPPNMDPLYGFGTVNVEAQRRDQHSLLNWMRRMLAVRKRYPAFGRGTLTLLHPKNRKVLSYVRQYNDDTLLCVANLAASPQAVELDLSRFADRIPVELNAGVLFPPIGELSYLLTLPPYGFYWFALAVTADHPAWHVPAPEPLPEFVTIVIRRGLQEAFSTPVASLIEDEALRQYLSKRRWFSVKDDKVTSARIINAVNVGDNTQEFVFTELQIMTKDETTRWLVPLGILWEDEPSASLPVRLALARIRRHQRVGLLTDAFALPQFAYRIVECLAVGKEFRADQGLVRFQPTEIGRLRLEGISKLEINWLAAERANSSLTVGDVATVKLYRRVLPGIHPEAEMNRYLTARGFTHAPSLLGDVVRVAGDGTPSTIAIAVEFVRNEGDAWIWLLDHLTRLLDAHTPAAPTMASVGDLLADCEAVCRAIGLRLGEMHAVLAHDTSESAFSPQIATAADIAKWTATIEKRIQKAFDGLSNFQTWRREEDKDRAKILLNETKGIITTVRTLAKAGEGTVMTRIHGDFHLGQVLVSDGDAFIIDFEGEPSTSTEERRAKTSPLRDVAGLLRSIDYVAASLVDREVVGSVPVDDAQRDLLMFQFRIRGSDAFLDAYWKVGGRRNTASTNSLLNLFLIEKAAYEIAYEASNRPAWIGVPVAGLLRLIGRTSE